MDEKFLDISFGRTSLNGNYRCTATNPLGDDSDHGSVNIRPSLNVRTNPAGPTLTLAVGDPLNVRCEATGDPDAESKWFQYVLSHHYVNYLKSSKIEHVIDVYVKKKGSVGWRKFPENFASVFLVI